MRVLVIDDLRILAIPGVDPTQVTYARTSGEAFSLLRDGRWDQVWFDHDLGGDDTAYPVAVELEAAAAGHAETVDVGQVFIHTDNIVGRPRLTAALRAYRPTVVGSASVTVGRIDEASPGAPAPGASDADAQLGPWRVVSALHRWGPELCTAVVHHDGTELLAVLSRDDDEARRWVWVAGRARPGTTDGRGEPQRGTPMRELYDGPVWRLLLAYDGGWELTEHPDYLAAFPDGGHVTY